MDRVGLWSSLQMMGIVLRVRREYGMRVRVRRESWSDIEEIWTRRRDKDGGNLNIGK